MGNAGHTAATWHQICRVPLWHRRAFLWPAAVVPSGCQGNICSPIGHQSSPPGCHSQLCPRITTERSLQALVSTNFPALKWSSNGLPASTAIQGLSSLLLSVQTPRTAVSLQCGIHPWDHCLAKFQKVGGEDSSLQLPHCGHTGPCILSYESCHLPGFHPHRQHTSSLLNIHLKGACVVIPSGAQPEEESRKQYHPVPLLTQLPLQPRQHLFNILTSLSPFVANFISIYCLNLKSWACKVEHREYSQ